MISMNPAEFLLDLANGNLNDVTVPSELEDKVQIDEEETEKTSGKPSSAVIHEVSHPCRSNTSKLKGKFYMGIRHPSIFDIFYLVPIQVFESHMVHLVPPQTINTSFARNMA